MSDAEKKSTRLNLIVTILGGARHGLTTRQLAERLGVSQRTVQRDLADLQEPSYGVPLVEDAGRWQLLEDYKPLLPAVRLTAPEATALALAARLLQRASDEQNPHVLAALAKLKEVLPAALREHLQRLDEAPASPVIPAFADNFEVLAQAWGSRHTVRIAYQPPADGDPVETDFDVYCIEPVAPSFAYYAIGFSHRQQGIRTYKLERVRRAELTDRSFEPDPTFDPAEHLGSGWGIWGGKDLHTVRLRFAPEVRWRLHEGTYHHTQQLIEQPDGACVVTFQVAAPIEMLSFIRGWGPKVQVLEPADLREQVAREARETTALYEASGRPGEPLPERARRRATGRRARPSQG
ncbi:MAG: transcriptional regulator, partial [Chloroflexi bacterium]|nr:transcriptional regulator [Chloroflexota bacterium]